MEMLTIEELEEIVISLNRTLRAFGTLRLPFNQSIAFYHEPNKKQLTRRKPINVLTSMAFVQYFLYLDSK